MPCFVIIRSRPSRSVCGRFAAPLAATSRAIDDCDHALQLDPCEALAYTTATAHAKREELNRLLPIAPTRALDREDILALYTRVMPGCR